MITAVPTPIPVNTPMPETVAIAVEELLHEPPVVASLNVIVDPTQVVDGPPIAAGDGVTVTVAVWLHPVPSE